MVAVTSVMRAHQILLARVENALRPLDDPSFSRFELLRLLAFSRSGRCHHQDLGSVAGARHQRHHAIRRLEADGLVKQVPHPTGRRTTLVQITELGRSTVEDATVTLNDQVFADVGMSSAEAGRWSRRSRRCVTTPGTLIPLEVARSGSLRE